MKSIRIPKGLHIRPSTPSDKAFLEKLYHSMRQDLKLIDGERDFIENIIELQYHAQTSGYGKSFPNAMYFIIEKLNEPIGKATLDFGPNEIRLVEIAFLPKARNHGFGRAIIESFQHCAAQSMTPLTLSVLLTNLQAIQLYLNLGFRVESVSPPYQFMSWYPSGGQFASL